MAHRTTALPRALAAATLGAALLLAPLARAADAPISDEARGHFKAGVALLQDPDGERVEEAYREFRAAYERSHSPKILGNMGLCAMKLERDGEAIEAYSGYLREVTDIEPSDRAQITRDLQTLTTGVVQVRLTVTAPAGTKVIVTDVRTPVRGDRVTNSYAVSPDGKLTLGVRSGHHVLTLRAPGFQDESWEIDALAGSKEARDVTLKPQRTEPRVPPGAGRDAPSESSPSRVPWVVAGVGGAMVVAGSITGIVALGKQRDLTNACPGDLCPSTFDLAGARSSAKTMIGVTDVLLIGGGVLVAGGVTWALLSPGASRPPPAGAVGAGPVAARSALSGLPALSASCGESGCSATARGTF